ncbi:nuclear transport factor 2 family protein [Rubrimonas sp.]|uniref:nuclear transport factor 2 family protein n=1 Tax=Rubrimonas sp. TaxID=2036015 RepID=UPI002FDCB2B5
MDATFNAEGQGIAAIMQAARDYAEGWYSGDAARMRRALHPALEKRTIARDPWRDGWTVRSPATNAEQMVRWTAEGVGAAWTSERLCEVQVQDVFRDIATVRCLSPKYVDYLQLARFGADGWRIVNVLWQLRAGDCEPSSDAEQELDFWRPRDA